MKWLLTILLISSLYGQGFGYNYIDPCNQQAVNLNYTTEMTGNVLVDLRNVYEPSVMQEAGFHYVSIGR